MGAYQGLQFSSRDQANTHINNFCVSNGFSSIAGVDECGRGPLVGEVVAACVLLPPNHGIVGITDSKRLTAKKREFLAEEIKEKSFWGIGSRSNKDIDRLNIRVATFQAAADAVMNCFYSGGIPDYVLCDGGLLISDMIPFPTDSVIKGDLFFECIGAASIVAKVYRDQQMAMYDSVWPEYGFSSNQGYGTKFHVEAINKYGVTPLHRRSFNICKHAKERKDV